MKTLGYYNGKMEELSNISVPMLDRACYFGDGVYDVTYAYNQKFFSLKEHLNHFFLSAQNLKIEPPITKENLELLLNDLILKIDSPKVWVYFQFSRGTALRNHPFPKSETANLWIMMRPGEIRPKDAPMECVVLPDLRHQICNIKSLNLLCNILAKQQATELGADEGIFHRGNTVTECTHSNISILKNGELITHPANEFIYAGIGRKHLLEKCKDFGIKTNERTFTVAELFYADEIIVTSATSLCSRVLSVDRTPVGGKSGLLFEKLQNALYFDFEMQTQKDRLS